MADDTDLNLDDLEEDEDLNAEYSNFLKLRMVKERD